MLMQGRLSPEAVRAVTELSERSVTQSVVSLGCCFALEGRRDYSWRRVGDEWVEVYRLHVTVPCPLPERELFHTPELRGVWGTASRTCRRHPNSRHTHDVSGIMGPDGGFVFDVDPRLVPLVQSVLAQFSRWARANFSAAASSVSNESSHESRPKGTDEAAEATTCTSNDVHGGDSASGEVPDGQSGGGQQQAAGSSVGTGAGQASVSGVPAMSESFPSEAGLPAEAAEVGPGAGTNAGPAGAGSSEPEPGQPDAERTAPITRMENAPSASPDADGEGTGGLPAPASEFLASLFGDADADTEPARLDEAVPSPGDADAEAASERTDEVRNVLRSTLRRSGAAAGPSTSSRRAHGGVFGSLRKITPPSPSLVSRARRALARMVHGGETEAGPRWDFDRFAVKVAGYLRQPDVRDRRTESGRPAILMLPDISGSMSAFAGEVLKLADAVRRVGVAGADVVVVAHSNGFPQEWAVNAGPVRNEPVQNELLVDDSTVWQWYEALIRRYNVRAVVVAADWDGEWLYRKLAEAGLDVYWLDVWSCSKFAARVVPFPPRWAAGVDWPEPARRRVRYAFACRTAEDAVRVLEEMLSGGTR